MITITKTLTTVDGEEKTNVYVAIINLLFSKSIIGQIDLNSELSELDQLKSFFKEIASIELGFFDSLDDAILKRFNYRHSYKFPNLDNKFTTPMNISELDKQDASIYFDEIIKKYLISKGISESDITIS